VNTNLLLDVAELALTHITEESSVTFVNIGKLYNKFIEGKTLCRSTASYDEFRKALITMFPIFKNNHKNTTKMKISINAAYKTCETLSIKLRPIEHIQRS